MRHTESDLQATRRKEAQQGRKKLRLLKHVKLFFSSPPLALNSITVSCCLLINLAPRSLFSPYAKLWTTTFVFLQMPCRYFLYLARLLLNLILPPTQSGSAALH